MLLMVTELVGCLLRIVTASQQHLGHIYNTKVEVVDLLRGLKVSMCSSTLNGILFKLCTEDSAAVRRKQRW